MIVVDASVAIKWFVQEEFSAEADALSATMLARGETLAAPPLLPMEVANALRQRLRRSAMALDNTLGLLNRLLAMPINYSFPAELTKQALIRADELSLPAVYDAHYIALAEHLGCDLWTADQRLLRTLGGRLPFVKWIGDYREN